MGSEGANYNDDSLSTPKLSLFSFPWKGKEPPSGMSTPPIHTLASIPFQWEEAPGKPRRNMISCRDDTSSSNPKPAAARCLELPPRLLCEASKITNNVNMSSPTTVLDGPDVGWSLSYTSSFRKGGSFRSTACNPPESWGKKEKVLFGSSRWGTFKKNSNNFDILASVGIGGGSGSSGGGGRGGDSGNSSGGGGGTKVKITRVRKRSVSFLSLKSHTASSHMWKNVCESFKQAVPWRRRHENLGKETGS